MSEPLTPHPVVGARWEPGNATRYDLAIVRVEPPGATAYTLLTWANAPTGGRCMRLPAWAADLHPSYIAEKLGAREEDARAILAWVRVALGEPEGE